MNIKPIKTPADYEAAVNRIEELMDAVSQADMDELDVLGTLVDVYEREHFPIEAPSPIEAIKFRMDQMGLKQSDIAAVLGAKSRVSEILAGKRALTVGMIQGLHTKLNIPFASLISQSGGAAYRGAVKKPVSKSAGRRSSKKKPTRRALAYAGK